MSKTKYVGDLEWEDLRGIHILSYEDTSKARIKQWARTHDVWGTLKISVEGCDSIEEYEVKHFKLHKTFDARESFIK